MLILDEPTSELDEHATKRIVTILKNLKEQGITILLVEHKFDHFKEMVDTLVVMENGAISAIGAPDEVLKDKRMRQIVIPDFSGIRDVKSGEPKKNQSESLPVISRPAPVLLL